VMYEPEKSDSVVVAAMPVNKAARAAAEPEEPRTGTKGNVGQQSTRRAQDRESVSQALERVRQAARQRKKERFTALLHHVDQAMLRTAFYAIKRAAAPGVDGMTWETYEQGLDRRIEYLHARVKNGAYRALPSRRSYIPKEDGSKRPLAVAALEDKIVQRATAAVLSAIYEEDFLGFSYGFRPGCSRHDALDALIVGISSRKVNFILDADIRSFFTEVSQQWVVRLLEHRIGDKRIIRLVQKWLRAGILEDGIVTIPPIQKRRPSPASPEGYRCPSSVPSTRCKFFGFAGALAKRALYSAMNAGRRAFPSARSDAPASRGSLTSRSCKVLCARSTRPFAWLELAQMMSMLSASSARPNWVMPSPPVARP